MFELGQAPGTGKPTDTLKCSSQGEFRAGTDPKSSNPSTVGQNPPSSGREGTAGSQMSPCSQGHSWAQNRSKIRFFDPRATLPTQDHVAIPHDASPCTGAGHRDIPLPWGQIQAPHTTAPRRLWPCSTSVPNPLGPSNERGQGLAGEMHPHCPHSPIGRDKPSQPSPGGPRALSPFAGTLGLPGPRSGRGSGQRGQPRGRTPRGPWLGHREAAPGVPSKSA